MANNEINWQKHHRFMPYEGWCGPTVIKIIFSACNIKKSIYEIAWYVYKGWWGTPSQLFIAYLSKFFVLVNYKMNATISDIAAHLKLGHIVIINWWDKDGGHYSIVSSYKEGWLTIIDSSRERDWQWVMTGKELRRVWYDTLNVDDSLYHEGLMIWLDSTRKKIK